MCYLWVGTPLFAGAGGEVDSHLVSSIYSRFSLVAPRVSENFWDLRSFYLLQDVCRLFLILLILVDSLAGLLVLAIPPLREVAIAMPAENSLSVSAGDLNFVE